MQTAPTPTLPPNAPTAIAASLAPAPATTPVALTARIKRGRQEKPYRVLIYGSDKVGKTTFATKAPEPILICPDDGSQHHDVARFDAPKIWKDVLGCVQLLLDEPHAFKTLVIDGVSWLEPLVQEYVCRRDSKLTRDGKPDINKYDFGAGYKAELEEFRLLIAMMERLWREKDMHILLLAHAHIEKQKNNSGEDYGLIGPKVHRLSADFFCEWCDAILYTEIQKIVWAEGDGNRRRVKTISDGKRVMHTERAGGYRAGNRYSLPAELPLSWEALDEAIRVSPELMAKKLTDEIMAKLPSIGDTAVRGKIQGWLTEKPRTADDLREALNRVNTLIDAGIPEAPAKDSV